MEKNITVKELVEGYKKCGETVKNKYIAKNVKAEPYLPSVLKGVIADTIINNSCKDRNGNIQIDSFRRYSLTMYALIDNYTNIKIEPSQWVEDYDLMKSAGIFEEIINTIPSSEFSEMNTVIRMKYDDFMINLYDPRAYIERQVSKLTPYLSAFLDEVGANIKGKTDSGKLIDLKKDNKDL